MEEIIKYVMETPENTNGNILREQLKSMGFDESNIEEAIGLIMNNLGSLNWNILREGLESLDDSGSSTKTRRVLFEGELTADDSGATDAVAALPSISDWPFDKTSIIVTFDGSEYTLPKKVSAPSGSVTVHVYGDMGIEDSAPSYERYPCAVMAYDPEIDLGGQSTRGGVMTENPGTYNVKIEVEE